MGLREPRRARCFRSHVIAAARAPSEGRRVHATQFHRHGTCHRRRNGTHL